MEERAKWIAYCLTLPGAYEDYPFDDLNWTALRHREGQKIFALAYERLGKLLINLKCEPAEGDFLRRACPGILPAYHMNKAHWVTADPAVTAEETLKGLIRRSWELTLPGAGRKNHPGKEAPHGWKTPR
ncbi:MAG: MmcQ/YjbR family DNA-binding protein [Oscillospiraceae bacterium]|nr:MmcQ/YjbR family DNA-binding protein [Oscillospiraceae bacterium]